MLVNHDLGASVFKGWSANQRREEIAKLVQGYRAGLPVGVLCKMTETIAGSRKAARRVLRELLTQEERQKACEQETGGMQLIARQFLL